MSPMLDVLPRADSSTLVLAHPTPEEFLEQSTLNGNEWRGALSLPAYLRREGVLSSQKLTQNGGITYWILIDTTLKGNPLEPHSTTRLTLASCETYRKKALVWQDGKLRQVICHGIGSVFCAPHLRRRGYAQRMMQEVGNALRTYQTTKDTPCLFSVLFSDIGKKFYADYGWEPFNSSHVSLHLANSNRIDDSGLPTARPLFADDLSELCKIDEALVRKSLESRARSSNTAVALIPDIETIQWHHARENFVGTELHEKSPKVKGAIVGTEIGKRVWCYWTRMWYNEDPSKSQGNTLHVLRIVIEDETNASWEGTGISHTNGNTVGHGHDAAIAALFRMAQKEAEEWGMERIEAWNPSSETLAAAQRLDPNARVVKRDTESIASLQWFPPHDGPVAEKIDWISNEKYVWC